MLEKTNTAAWPGEHEIADTSASDTVLADRLVAV